MMERIVPIIPLGRTPAWTTGVLEMLRQSITSDPKWQNGNYPANDPPEQGLRLWSGWISGVIVRTPAYQESLMPKSQDAIAFIQKLQNNWRRVDAADWVYQSWAYHQHDVGATPGFNGDYARALKSIKARTLILAGTTDLLNPEFEAREVAKHIPDARYVSIDAKVPMGHVAGAGISAPENEVQNREIGRFLETLPGGRR